MGQQIATTISQFLNIVPQQECKIPQLARKMDASALNQQQLTLTEDGIKAVGGQSAAVQYGLLKPDADIVISPI
jgi:hypothetical protein